MTWERFESRTTMYIAMAIYIHLARDIWYGVFPILMIMAASVAAMYLTPENFQKLRR